MTNTSPLMVPTRAKTVGIILILDTDQKVHKTF